MSKVFYEMEQATLALGVSVEEMEEMFSTGELRVVRVGERRRLVRIADVEALLERVRSGVGLRTHREFRGATVEKALAQAASRLDVDPDLLPYRILRDERPWSPGTDGSQARIVVELPENKVQPLEPGSESVVGSSSASDGEKGGYYYAPGQVAVLLGTDANEVNLWIYLKELPAVDINGYRWVPKGAVNERLIRSSAPKVENPPKPFFIVTPEEPENAVHFRAGVQEITADKTLPSPDFLRRKLDDLDAEIQALTDELAAERLRRAQEPADSQAQIPAENAAASAVERLARRTGFMHGPAESPA